MKLPRLGAAALLAAAMLAGAPAHSATPLPFLGRWLIAEAHPAPWVMAGDAASASPDARLVGMTLVYERARIRGPRLLACRRPNYQVLSVEPEGLFQGNLTAPAAQAGALGYSGSAIQTLQTGCAGAIDFHFLDSRTAIFALDNVLYTIRKQR